MSRFFSKSGWLSCKYGKLSAWVPMWVVLNEKGVNIGLPTELGLARGVTVPVAIAIIDLLGARVDNVSYNCKFSFLIRTLEAWRCTVLSCICRRRLN